MAGYALEDVPATIELGEGGVTKGTMAFTSTFSNAVGLALALKVHPDYSWLTRKTAAITRVEGGWATLVVNFEGVPPNTEEDEDEKDDGDGRKLYSVKSSTSSEPIETHPDFWGMADSYEAKFDDNDKFLAFPSYLSDGSESDFGGVKSFLVPSLTYEESYTKSKAVLGTLLGDLGMISSPPASGVLPVVNGCDWLMSGGDVSQVGDGIKVTRTWKLSGRKGWDGWIYGTAGAAAGAGGAGGALGAGGAGGGLKSGGGSTATKPAAIKT